MVTYQLKTLLAVVLNGLLQQYGLELLLVELSCRLVYLDEHLDGGTNLWLVNDTSIPLCLDLLHEQTYESFLQSRVQNDMVLELTVLHILH